MGSPSARLNTPESLRAWVESGLEFAYCPGGVRVEDPGPAAVQGAVGPHTPPPAEQSGARQPGRVQTAPQGRAPQQRSVQPPASQQTPPQQAAPRAPNPSGFPGPWAGFLKFTKPEAKVVMTYMELGLDLGGQADKRRSDVLKNLQAHLRWPPGTINFWPCSALHDNALQPDTGLFWKGWELWRTPTIACFGEEALRVILPDADPSRTTHMLEHVMVYVLPPMTQLTALLPHEQQLSVDVLTKIRF